jgi:hypothetical protein
MWREGGGGPERAGGTAAFKQPMNTFFIESRSRDGAPGGEHRPDGYSGPIICQELGTIEGRSTGVTVASGARLRPNNIRRSKALERIEGKR